MLTHNNTLTHINPPHPPPVGPVLQPDLSAIRAAAASLRMLGEVCVSVWPRTRMPSEARAGRGSSLEQEVRVERSSSCSSSCFSCRTFSNWHNFSISLWTRESRASAPAGDRQEDRQEDRCSQWGLGLAALVLQRWCCGLGAAALVYLQAAEPGCSAPGGRWSCRRPTGRPSGRRAEWGGRRPAEPTWGTNGGWRRPLLANPVTATTNL